MLADKLPITGPCPIDLDAIGFDRSSKVSHCTHCVKSVTNLSNMTRDEARDFLREHKGEKLCVSYACDSTGSIRFRPEPEPALVPVTRLRPRPAAAPQAVASLPPRKLPRTAGFVAALGVSAALAACAPHGEPPRDTTTTVAAKPITEPQPEVTEVAGGIMVPQEVMMDGEIAVPDPETIDEPCDKTRDQGKGKRKDPPKPDTTKVEPPAPDPIPTAGLAVIPSDAMVEGELEVPETLEEPTHARIRPRR